MLVVEFLEHIRLELLIVPDGLQDFLSLVVRRGLHEIGDLRRMQPRDATRAEPEPRCRDVPDEQLGLGPRYELGVLVLVAAEPWYPHPPAAICSSSATRPSSAWRPRRGRSSAFTIGRVISWSAATDGDGVAGRRGAVGQQSIAPCSYLGTQPHARPGPLICGRPARRDRAPRAFAGGQRHIHRAHVYRLARRQLVPGDDALASAARASRQPRRRRDLTRGGQAIR